MEALKWLVLRVSGGVTAPPRDGGSGSVERLAGDDAVAGSGDGGTQARVELRLRPSGGVGELSPDGSADASACRTLQDR